MAERKVGFELRVVSNEFKRFLGNHLKDKETTGQQHGIMDFIARHENVYQRDVEREFGIRRSSATGIIKLMEKNGLIVRVVEERDARLKRLVLTDRAHILREKGKRDIEAIEKILKRDISEEELSAFFRVLDKISKNISEGGTKE